MAEIINSLASGLEQAITQAVQKAVGSQQPAAQTAQPIQQSQAQVKANTTAVTTPQPTNIAAPTDASSVKSPLPKVGNMKTGEYVNPNQGQQQQLVSQLGAAKTYETPQETKNMLKGLFVSQTEKYNYAAENDPLVIQARKNLEQSVTNMVAKRGFGAVSGVQDLVDYRMTQMIPQFETIARGEHADFLDRQLSLANTMMQWEQIQFDRSKDQIQLITAKLEAFNKMSDRDFNIFKSMLDQRNMNRTIFLQQQKYLLDRKLKENKIALERLENLGYVDEDASIILGAPIGTKAKWAQQLALEQANKLELLAKENEYNLKKQQLDADLEKELYALKNKLDLESQLKLEAMTYEYKKQLQDIEIKKQADEIRYKQEQAEAAAAARSSSGGGGSSRRSSGGSKSKKSSSSSKAKPKTNAELDVEYAAADKYMEPRVASYYKNDWASGVYVNEAKSKVTQDLDELYRQGMSPEVIAALRRQYEV